MLVPMPMIQMRIRQLPIRWHNPTVTKYPPLQGIHRCKVPTVARRSLPQSSMARAPATRSASHCRFPHPRSLPDHIRPRGQNSNEAMRLLEKMPPQKNMWVDFLGFIRPFPHRRVVTVPVRVYPRLDIFSGMGSCAQGLFCNDRFQAVYVDGAGRLDESILVEPALQSPLDAGAHASKNPSPIW